MDARNHLRLSVFHLTALSLAVPPAAAADEDPFAARILDARPRVFLRDDDRFEGLTIRKLRDRAGTPEFAAIRGKWRSKPLGRAILWMLDGRREDLDAAIAGLERMDASGGSWSDRGLALTELSALYDWLYPALDEPAREAAAGKIERAADDAAAHIRGGRAPFYYSRTPGALAGMTIAGIALHGASAKADAYLDLFRERGAKDYFKAYEWVDGAATGATYTLFYTYVDLPQIAAAWWSATGKNPQPWIRAHQGDWLDGIVRFTLWSMRPGFAFLDINDQSRDTWGTHDQFCQGLDIASYVTRNGFGRAWSERWLGRFGPALYHTEYSHNFIFRDPTIEARPLADLPHAQLFGRESCGYGFFRSAWPAEGEPDAATHVFFRCGDPLNVHGGVSAGEFQIFKYAPLASRSGRYSSYDSPPDQYHRNAISTNVVLFTDPAVPNDRGDQNTRSGLKSDHRTWADWLAIRERNRLDVATITDWRVDAKEARCRADLSRTVPESKCRRWIREFVWLNDAHLIVLDIVETAKPEIRRLWQLHALARPEVGPNLLTILHRPPERSWADGRLKPKREEARLFCRTLLPRAHEVVVHADRKAEAFDPAGRSRGAVEGDPHHLQFGGYVVQIDPGNEGTRTVFLHVLTAVDADRAKPPDATCRLAKPGRLDVTVDGATMALAVPDWLKRSP
ncbi:MAG: hypothetical protein JXP34_08380 [Planctomycetes bacterium]|nr:hypothetical protein [Planctomycetota bacterium]